MEKESTFRLSASPPLPRIERRRWQTGSIALALVFVIILSRDLTSFSYDRLRSHYYDIVTGHQTVDCRMSRISPYGQFPVAGDPFRFLPCTNATVPPALDDPSHESSWADLFDPNPDNWSWGYNSSVSEENDDKYAGQGIYLCGYLDVPLDYTNSSDPRIVRLAVTKYQVSGLSPLDSVADKNSARGSKSERTIVVEPGGPGGSGTSMVWRSAENITTRLSDGAYDVLGWDPRGVNTSLPALSCFPYDADRDRWSLLTGSYREVSGSPEMQLEIADAMSEAIARACWEQHSDLPRFMGTGFVARDMEEIRKATGEDELTGYLVSYGTGIGQTYVSIFPDSAGRIILDGTEYVRDHRLLGGFGWTALDNVTDAWHDGFLGECINAGPKHCALAQPRGGELVTLKTLEKRMDVLIKSLIQRPIPGYSERSGPSLVTYSTLVAAIYSSMYNAHSWPALAEMLYELEAGNSTLATRMLEKAAWEYDPTLPSPPAPKPASDELGYIVICADSYDAPPKDLVWWQSLWMNMTEKSWIAGNSRFYDVFPCRHFVDYWPEPAGVYRGPLNHTLKHPVLLIAEAYDPATPLRNGRRLAAEMGPNAQLIAHHAYGHSSGRDISSCTDAIAKKYILTGKLPEEPETACYADKKPYLYDVDTKSASVHANDDTDTDLADFDALAVWQEHVQEMAYLNPRLI
ncbi:Alpha/Beta hydrolase protein [Xylariaceae sp. FL0255]|nr:Alpha/Beta hydrolase protein [Xylariaceae sp. FL0255]